MRVAFIGDQKTGEFEMPGEAVYPMLDLHNPDGRSNRDVLRPWVNGQDLVQRPSGRWIADFGTSRTREEAALYEAPYDWVRNRVRPLREESGIGSDTWWLHWRARPEMRRAIGRIRRYIATPGTSKHRIFVWLPPEVLPDHALVVIAREDDYTFGVLHSRPHELWSRRLGTQLREYESGLRYAPRIFETFPLPRPTDEQREAIAGAARRLNELRDGWLNPPGASDEELEQRTVTNLYNEMPAWLRDAHTALDRAVFDAYGWPADISDDDLLGRLLALNLARAATVPSMT